MESKEFFLIKNICSRFIDGKAINLNLVGIDLDIVYNLANRHKVVPIAQSYLMKLGHTNFDNYAKNTIINNLLKCKEIIDLGNILTLNKQKFLFYKGSSLFANKIYPNTNFREIGDCDIVLPKDQVKETIKILVENGYFVEKKYNELGNEKYLELSYEVNLWKKIYMTNYFFNIDLHWALAQENILKIDYSALEKDSIVEQILAITVHHGLKERWMCLRHLVDLAFLLKQLEDADGLIEKLEEFNITKIFTIGIYYLQKHLDVQLSSNLLEKININFEIKFWSVVFEKSWEKPIPFGQLTLKSLIFNYILSNNKKEILYKSLKYYFRPEVLNQTKRFKKLDRLKNIIIYSIRRGILRNNDGTEFYH